jgi:hypothetical protein
MEHRAEVIFIVREMKHGAADDEPRECIGKRIGFDGFHAEVIGGQHSRPGTNAIYGTRIAIAGEYFKTICEQVGQIAAIATSCVKYACPRGKSAAQKLVEKIDINLPKLGY